MSYRPLTAAGLAAIAAISLTMSTAFADSVSSTSCVGRWMWGTCVTTWGHGTGDPHIIPVPQPRSDEEIAQSRERERVWRERCHPHIVQDNYGVARYTYAAHGCEFGRTD